MTVKQQVDAAQAKMQEAATQAQEVASRRVRKIEADAKRVLEKLVDRAEQELRAFLAHASEPTQHQWVHLGSELVKLGQTIQSLAAAPVAGAPEVKSADVGAPEAKN